MAVSVANKSFLVTKVTFESKKGTLLAKCHFLVKKALFMEFEGDFYIEKRQFVGFLGRKG